MIAFAHQEWRRDPPPRIVPLPQPAPTWRASLRAVARPLAVAIGVFVAGTGAIALTRTAAPALTYEYLRDSVVPSVGPMLSRVAPVGVAGDSALARLTRLGFGCRETATDPRGVQVSCLAGATVAPGDARRVVVRLTVTDGRVSAVRPCVTQVRVRSVAVSDSAQGVWGVCGGG